MGQAFVLVPHQFVGKPFHDAGGEAHTHLHQLRISILNVGPGEAVPDGDRRAVLDVA